MTRQLFDYWFVQFDFPDEYGNPYKSSGGKMIWNEKLKKDVPQGWEVLSFEELGAFRNGINYSKSDSGDKKYRIVNVRNITASSLILNEQEMDELYLNSSTAEKYRITDSDILIARSGNPGATRILPVSDSDTVFCGFIICFSLKQITHKALITYRLKELESATKGQSSGSILSNISQDILRRQLIALPPRAIINKWNDIILPIWSIISSLKKSSVEIIGFRQSLLPLILSGQISVRRLNNHLSDCREECPFHVFMATKSVSLLCESLRIAFTKSPASRAMVCCWS